MNKLGRDELQRFKKQLFEKEKILREIDLTQDIDLEQSDQYSINLNSGYVEFQYSSVKVISAEDIIAMFGQVYDRDGKIIFNIKDNKVKHSKVMGSAGGIIDIPIDIAETDIVDIQFKQENDEKIDILQISQHDYEDLLDKLDQNVGDKLKVFQSPKSDVLVSAFRTDSFQLYRKQGERYSEKEFVVKNHQNEHIQYVMNLKEKSVQLNFAKGKIYYGHNDIKDKDLRYLYIHVYPNQELNFINSYINSIILGKNEGYIYLNPVENIAVDKVKVTMLYSGTPQVEYYKSQENKWCSINEKDTINVSNRIRLRMKMKIKDRILGIWLCNSSEG